MTENDRFGFTEAQNEAERLVGDLEKMLDLAARAHTKALEVRSELESSWFDLTSLIQFIEAYSRDEYRETSEENVSIALAALVYFVEPFDEIPDELPEVGLLDDRGVIEQVAVSIRDDLERFRQWQKKQQTSSPG